MQTTLTLLPGLISLFAIVALLSGSLPKAGARGQLFGLMLLWFCVGAVVGVQGSTFSIPDSLEYLAVAKRFSLGGDATLILDGVTYPSRYLPWFSEIVLAPAFVFGGHPAASALITALIVGLTFAASSGVGAGIGGVLGAALAPAAVLIVPGVRYFGREPMTDVAGALCCLLLLLSRQRENRVEREIVLAGFAVFLAAVCRPLYGVLIFPALFLRDGSRCWRVLATIPLILLVAASAAYQLKTFGSMFRSGYHLWTGVPYDYFALTFSTHYLTGNIQAICGDPVLLPVVLAWMSTVVLALRGVLVARSHQLNAAVLRTIPILGTLVLVVVPIHLFYFYATSRFFLALSVCAVTILGGVAGGWIGHFRPIGAQVGASLISLCVLCGALKLMPLRTLESSVESVLQKTKSNSTEPPILVSAMNPLLPYLFDAPVTFVPISRRVEFASKLLTWSRIDRSKISPQSPRDHRAAGLLDAGARECFGSTALEDPGGIGRAREGGVDVFIDSSLFTLDEKRELGRPLKIREIGEELFLGE